MSLRLRRVAVCWLCLETRLLFKVRMLHVARGEVKGVGGHVAKRREQRRWLCVVAALTWALVVAGGSAEAEQKSSSPNILFILTDDMASSDLRHMPNTQRLLADQGTTTGDDL